MDLTKIFIEKFLYPAMEKKKGNKIREYTQELIENQRKSENFINWLQKEKLTKLLRHCKKYVPAYKNLRINDADIQINPLYTLSKIPVLFKDDLRKDSTKYISDDVDKNALIANISGGSTGESVRFYIDRKTVEYFEAARWRGLSWYGITYGSRSVMIWGNPIELDKNGMKKYRSKERYLKNRILIPAYDLSPDKIKSYVREINKFRPEYIYGYSSSLEMFSKLMMENNLKLNLNLKAVVSTAENLFPEQRVIIERGFNCVCVNEYGARDGGIIAYECPDHQMHLSMENVLVEVLDPQTLEPVPRGQPGLAVITDLNNFSMPRLRYAVGDVVTLSTRPCKCLRPLEVLEDVQGREEAILVRPDGSFAHGHSISHYARKRTIVCYQFVQTSPKSAILYVEKGKNPKAYVDEFVKELSQFLGNLQIQVEEVDQLKTSKSGKFRYTIRDFDLKSNSDTNTNY